MNTEQLNTILKEHRDWLQSSGGKRADLRYANLSSANLRYADLSNADLSNANLRGANLSNANLRYIKTNYLTTGIHTAPEGELIAWKKVKGTIIKLLIPKEAKRSCATSRKHRSNYVITLEIEGNIQEIINNNYDQQTVYQIGKETHSDSWDENRWDECSNGIHWFLTHEEAVNW